MKDLIQEYLQKQKTVAAIKNFLTLSQLVFARATHANTKLWLTDKAPFLLMFTTIDLIIIIFIFTHKGFSPLLHMTALKLWQRAWSYYAVTQSFLKQCPLNISLSFRFI